MDFRYPLEQRVWVLGIAKIQEIQNGQGRAGIYVMITGYIGQQMAGVNVLAAADF